jgi:putative membrane protein insertion efficiency factor
MSLTEFQGELIIKKIFLQLFLILIRAYQYIVSPVLTPACRFYPTCSNYAYQALAQYGLARGSYLALKRVLKCHPFHSGGIDPIP